MIYSQLSKKQLQAMLWWRVPSLEGFDALIADGSVRSGKTMSMTVGFLMWACSVFDGQSFAICGKTIESLRRNVVLHLREWLPDDFDVLEKRQENALIVSFNGHTNRFHMFGGRDESSYMLIQGMTLAGVFFDEVALQPRSFVEQALARCSVDGSRFWFNCNPSSPEHWFYKEWVQGAASKNALRLHFTMDDNLSLSDKIRERYENMYSGVFYDRYIRGLWVLAEGLVYPLAPTGAYDAPPPDTCDRYFVAMDYGIQNATAMLLFGRHDGIWYVVDEYYHSGRDTQEQKTDEEYYEALCDLVGDRAIDCVIVDPSASSFITLVRKRHRFKVRKAHNDVLKGIQDTATALTEGFVKVCAEACPNVTREFGLYVWSDKPSDKDKVVKENDHSMDALRYGVETMELYEKKPDYVPLAQRQRFRPLGQGGVF
jgi:PBSX family phage terminase large subunit